MGEFVAEAYRIVELNVIVARDASEENLVSFGVDGNNHIDVATGDGANFASSVDTANKNIERFFGDIEVV